MFFGGLLNPYFLHPPLALESWRGWRSARAWPHPRWDPRVASPGPSALGRGAPEATWQPVNQHISQMKTLPEAFSRAPAPLRGPDFSISIHLSWKKISKLFPITNSPAFCKAGHGALPASSTPRGMASCLYLPQAPGPWAVSVPTDQWAGAAASPGPPSQLATPGISAGETSLAVPGAASSGTT